MRSIQSQIHPYGRFRIVFVFMLWSCCCYHRCWSYSPKTNRNNNAVKNNKFHGIVSNTVVATLAIWGSTLSSSNAAIDEPIINISEETLRQGLSQPTKLQPQIQLDSTTTTTRITPTITKKEKLPILQGTVPYTPLIEIILLS